MAEILTEADVINADVNFLIDNDLRIISIPETGVVLGVEGDKDINVLTFQLPREYRGTDLSTFNIRIHYANANGDRDYYTVTDKTTSTDYVTFTWVPSALATAYIGNATFIVHLYTADASGKIIQSFNTTVATVEVKTGLPLGEIPPEFEEDLLDHLKADMTTFTTARKAEITTLTNTSLAEMETKRTAANTDIANKGATTLASIPEDYTSLANDVSEVKEDLVKLGKEEKSDSDFEWTVGYYASHLQGLIANAIAKTSSTVLLNKGDTIKIKTRVYNSGMAVMFKCKYDGTPTELIYAGDDGTYKEYAFTSGETCFVRFTVWVSYGFECEVYRKGSSSIFYVSKDSTGHFSSFTQALKTLNTIDGEKTLYVNSGEYDIYEELGGDAFINSIENPSSKNWRDVNAIVPKDTHIIGQGMVRLVYNPTEEQIKSDAMAFLFSPLNVSDSCEIENIEIACSNCRYGIHDEASGLAMYADTRHVYRNVRVYKTWTKYGKPMAFGAGLGARCRWEFDSCIFMNNIGGSIWSTHTATSEKNDGANIVFNNCIFDGIETTDAMQWYEMVRFLNGADVNHKAERNVVRMNGCYVKGKVAVVNEASTPIKQTFDITAVGCHAKEFKTTGEFTTNPYPVAEYMGN